MKIFEQLTKVERAGLVAIIVVIAIIVSVNYWLQNRATEPLTAQEQKGLAAFKQQVKTFKADTLTQKPKKKKCKRKKSSNTVNNEPVDISTVKMERYEGD